MHSISTAQKIERPSILKDFEYTESVKDLADELQSIMVEMSRTSSALIIETNHRIGEAIVNHTAYKKSRHGSGALIKQLALETGKSVQHFYSCIKFYERYPKVSNALETLQPDKANLSWRNVVASLSDSQDSKPCKHEEIYTVKYLCCRNCGSRIK